MNIPVSIFIMDVSSSSRGGNGYELAEYLDSLVEWMVTAAAGIVPIQAKHRAGDEIIVIAEGFSTAYILAFYLRSIWKYGGQEPYFGLSFGSIGSKVEEIDPEKWIHPLAKKAREANDLLKQEQTSRPHFKFRIDGNKPSLFDGYGPEFEWLLNAVLAQQQEYISNQTELQKNVFSLYLIFKKQKVVADLLKKTPATISSHVKKGKGEELLDSCSGLVKILNSLEEKSCTITDSPFSIAETLHRSIKETLKEVFKP
ncbi:sigma-70 family RNA polymerase sigma factor [Mesobacillus zeae]|uniref:Sigma-70 family RNA polymerase sigma factor n=1 Tax=Mesobacillus zeae TaxID=1917180 RepID=A0A398BD94_9BACI|nr:sigma-70 family RNA polymerase sigma factor [Mesobacillus zeae]RID85730.1 sigma-70 family RNA polymerase sigma factor [Mesobacillus zeae]